VPENQHDEQNGSGYDPNNAMVTTIAAGLYSSTAGSVCVCVCVCVVDNFLSLVSFLSRRFGDL